MAEVEILSPLYETGVHHAGVHSPASGPAPDPMGWLDPTGKQAPMVNAGGGDDTNDWKALPPGGKK